MNVCTRTYVYVRSKGVDSRGNYWIISRKYRLKQPSHWPGLFDMSLKNLGFLGFFKKPKKPKKFEFRFFRFFKK